MSNLTGTGKVWFKPSEFSLPYCHAWSLCTFIFEVQHFGYKHDSAWLYIFSFSWSAQQRQNTRPKMPLPSLSMCFWVDVQLKILKFRYPTFVVQGYSCRFSAPALDIVLIPAATRRGPEGQVWWPRTCLPLAKTHCLLGVLRGFQKWGMTLPGHRGSKPSRGWSWGSVWRKTSVWPSSSDQDLGPPGFISASRKIISVYQIIVSLYPNNELSCSLWFLFYFF